MGLATLNGVPFRLDPESIAWSYTVRTADIKTVGGRVIQVLGATIDDMRVTGSFGKGGIREQETFLSRMQDIGNEQVADAGILNSTKPPLHFVYPPKKWDFLVYLRAYTEPGSSMSVQARPENFAPRWQLTFFVVDDNAGLKTIAKDQFISRMAQGLGWNQIKNVGWRQTLYNGPMTMSDVENAIGTTDVQGYIAQVYGQTQTSSGNE
jgi:hypothetical protein